MNRVLASHDCPCGFRNEIELGRFAEGDMPAAPTDAPTCPGCKVAAVPFSSFVVISHRAPFAPVPEPASLFERMAAATRKAEPAAAVAPMAAKPTRAHRVPTAAPAGLLL